VPALTTTILRKQLAEGDTDPLYMLVGADDLEKSAVAAEFAEMVEEDLRVFNVERMYGGETKVDAVIDAASTLPMMAPRRVIVIAEAEKILMPKRESKASEAEQ
jgi:DNA polymerase III delta subunit